MRKILLPLLYLVAVCGILLAIHSGLPKYDYVLPWFGTLMILDLYLWQTVKTAFRPALLPFRILSFVLYWLPFGIAAGCVIAGFFLPIQSWNIPFRTYITGITVILYFSRVFPVLFLMIADFIRILRYLAANLTNHHRIHFKNFRRWKYFSYAGWILHFAIILILVWGMIYGIYNFRVHKQELILPELPASFNGMTIAQISDLHLGSWPCKARLSEAIGMVNALEPDLVFCTGDIANFSTVDAGEYMDILSMLKSRNGIFAIMGNHDYGDYIPWKDSASKSKNLTGLRDLYRRLGWNLLLNEHRIIKRDSDSVAVIGVENWGSRRRFQHKADLPKALEGIRNMEVLLLLSHDPSFWDKHVRTEYPEIDVTFSGHTHGFQVGFETGSIRWSPLEFLNDRWAGLYSSESGKGHVSCLYVNRGLGTIWFPVRIGIRPEITLFILKKR
jgi:predicted MPP superfamily phosphohydrolase